MWLSSASAGRAQRPDAQSGNRFPSVTAHAGSLETPANTLASFQAALAYPVDHLEADVRFTAEKAAYLSHDPLPSPLQARAMSLQDLLTLVKEHPGVGLNLDLKEITGIRELVALVVEAGAADRVVMTGITRSTVSAVRAAAQGVAYLLNAAPGPSQRFTTAGAAALCRTIRECGARGLNVHHLLISRRLASTLADAGLQLSVWTVDSLREMKRMIGLPVDNITTGRIDLLLSLRNGRNA